MASYVVTDQIRERMRRSAKARGATGFLHPVSKYQVHCGTKLAHSGANKRDALHAFRRFKTWSILKQGNAAGKSVTLSKDGEIIESHL